MRVSSSSSLLITLCVAGATPASAGVVAETYSRAASGDAEIRESRMTFDGSQMRVETFDEGKPDGYFVVGQDRLIVADLKDRTYTVIDPVAMQARMAAMRQQMAATLKDLPAEQRAKMEAMMGGKAPGRADTKPRLNVRDTGRKDTVDGRSCRIVEVDDAGTVQQHCVVATSAIAGGAEMMASMRKVIEAMETAFADVAPMWGMTQAMAEYAAVDGIPVRTRQIRNGKVESEIFLKWIEQVTVPAETFAAPAGFKAKAMEPL
jgi:cell pole-organizing protein PopZ